MGKMHIMDETGDSKLIWDSENAVEVEAAQELFNKLKKKGHTAFAVKKNGEKGKVIDEFDPDMEKIIMAPKMQAG
jgi:hypothetical protein